MAGNKANEIIIYLAGAIATVILSVAVIYMLILKITGHSPTVAELSLSLSVLALTISTAMAGFLLTVSNKIGGLSSKISKLTGKFESFEKYAFSEKR